MQRHGMQEALHYIVDCEIWDQGVNYAGQNINTENARIEANPNYGSSWFQVDTCKCHPKFPNPNCLFHEVCLQKNAVTKFPATTECAV